MRPYSMTLVTAEEFSGIKRSRLYDLMGQGAIQAVKSGRRTLILSASLERYLANLPAATMRVPRTSA